MQERNRTTHKTIFKFQTNIKKIVHYDGRWRSQRDCEYITIQQNIDTSGIPGEIRYNTLIDEILKSQQGDYIGDEEAKEIAEALKFNNTITVFYLQVREARTKSFQV